MQRRACDELYSPAILPLNRVKEPINFFGRTIGRDWQERLKDRPRPEKIGVGPVYAGAGQGWNWSGL
jgi:hypothetical protein